ncbi:hypothetical protein BpHYR1_043721 [Brachionus plicatilis]|uniref:TIR domain-containing protein n=1 Tax=Brachionus plicatilis TaxID=10195 RepID=A0A3M7PPL9_BRAPC|nr:hypothetical protein BpHYR1_043721 [Brachionus plicatilis]
MKPDIKANLDNFTESLMRKFDFLSTRKDFMDLFIDKDYMQMTKKLFSANLQNFDKFEFINLACDLKFTKSIISGLNSCHEALKSSATNSNNQNKIYSSAAMLVSIIQTFSYYSAKFCTDFYQSNGLEVLFKYLNDKILISKYKSMANSNSCSIEVKKLVKGILNSLVNLSRSYSSFRNEWKKENSTFLILNLSSELANIEDSQLSCYIILAKISEEDEISKLQNLKIILPGIISIINQMAINLEKNKNVVRTKVQLSEMEVAEEVSKVSIGSTSWHLIDLLEALYSSAINDSIKESIYFEFQMKNGLRKIIFFGNQTEVNYALKLLWQLCFNIKIAEDVQNDQELLKLIQKYASKARCSENLKKNSTGCVWIINKKSLFKQNNVSQTESQVIAVKNQKKHIMISYNRDSRDLCLKIKKDLEKNGHKIWIDVENIHGSSLEAMAKAIEESQCVLMCMTEKYKQSSNCRAEAEYAFQLNKPIIPLIMQQNYKPDGWLGIILGSKIFVNFTKYEYDECLKRVNHEIDKLFKPKTEVAPPGAGLMAIPYQTDQNLVQDWNEQQVEKWFKEKNFNEIILKNVLPSDGKNLKQLHEMLLGAPEFFYTSISSKGSIPTRDILFFSNELKNLFNNE